MFRRFISVFNKITADYFVQEEHLQLGISNLYEKGRFNLNFIAAINT